MADSYRSSLRWTGSTGLGWDRYDRMHLAGAPPAEQELRLTTGEEKGDPRLLNPEQLVLMGASSCQMLWFLHLAAKARLDVIHYEDEADAEMPEDWLTRITLRPRIVVARDVGEDRVLRLVEQAHEHCYIAKSLRSEVVVEPRVDRLAGAADVVRLTFELNNSEDARRIRDAPLDILASVWDADCEFGSALGGVEGGTYRGFAGIRKYLEDLLETFSDWRVETVEVVEVRPDAAAAFSVMRGHGREGVPFERETASSWHLRAGKIFRARTLATREEALAAAGEPGA